MREREREREREICLGALLHNILSPESTDLPHLQPSGFSTHHELKHSDILQGAHFMFSVLYGSQKGQRLLLYTSLTDWFL